MKTKKKITKIILTYSSENLHLVLFTKNTGFDPKNNYESPLGVVNIINKTSNTELKKENLELQKELEKLKIDILDKTIELNKTKSDKFVLFEELNELVLSLRRTDIDKLNQFYKKSINNKNLNKFEMPTAKGIKYNILSAQSQIAKILKTDSITKKLNKSDDNLPNIDNLNINQHQTEEDRIQTEIYYSILKKTEDEFDALLDKKLQKRAKSFLYC